MKKISIYTAVYGSIFFFFALIFLGAMYSITVHSAEAKEWLISVPERGGDFFGSSERFNRYYTDRGYSPKPNDIVKTTCLIYDVFVCLHIVVCSMSLLYG